MRSVVVADADSKQPDVSVVVISFRTPALICRCLETLYASEGVDFEVIVVENGSDDESEEVICSRFPQVRLFVSEKNLGFGAAHNVAFRHVCGRYVVLVNSDAFVEKNTLSTAVSMMDNQPQVALAGAQLVGEEGQWQPSARMFPSALNDLLIMTGLSSRWPQSRFFGRPDRSWAPTDEAAYVDWVPGAFSIIRRNVLEQVGYFDESMFLYYEEVDLCRRIHAAGYKIAYWPQLKVIHIGGESARTLSDKSFSEGAQQLMLWRMRSELLYHRKQHGVLGALCAALVESAWQVVRLIRNLFRGGKYAQLNRRDALETVRLKRRAWRETHAGTISPKKPW